MNGSSANCESLIVACADDDIDWICNGPQDCLNGDKCCANADIHFNLKLGCENIVMNFPGTDCAAQCVPRRACAAKASAIHQQRFAVRRNQ